MLIHFTCYIVECFNSIGFVTEAVVRMCYYCCFSPQIKCAFERLVQIDITLTDGATWTGARNSK